MPEINGTKQLGDFEYQKFRADRNDKPAVATLTQETTPTDQSKNNSSTALSYDINGDLEYIDETINGIIYRTTLTYNTRVLVGISEVVQL